uniref:Uncharacterized protein n=1 Tax=Loigolactobacillus rennini TaxID=238013 RepID=A0A1K2I7Z9_9LACO|nr:hypothetical protein LREN565_1623 [Loigolactobacillus rennini]
MTPVFHNCFNVSIIKIIAQPHHKINPKSELTVLKHLLNFQAGNIAIYTI